MLIPPWASTFHHLQNIYEQLYTMNFITHVWLLCFESLNIIRYGRRSIHRCIRICTILFVRISSIPNNTWQWIYICVIICYLANIEISVIGLQNGAHEKPVCIHLLNRMRNNTKINIRDFTPFILCAHFRIKLSVPCHTKIRLLPYMQMS